MKFQSLYTNNQISQCRYGMSRLSFRGPAKSLAQPYVSFLGGTQTFGKGISVPFSERVEKRLGQTCVNFGVANASVDAFVNDPSILNLARDGAISVVEVTGAQNLSNRFYRVHPRRNDRFLQASTVLRALYPDVDFTEFDFTGHMLRTLRDRSGDRFEIVVTELQEAWTARMKTILDHLGQNVVLLWLRDEQLNDDVHCITKPMVTRLADHCIDVVEHKDEYGVGGLLSTDQHRDVGDSLAAVLRPLLK